MMKAEEVAKKTFEGIKSAAFIVPCNLEGALLSIATAGMSPQRSFVMAFVEVVAAGLVRLVALFFQWNWYNGIRTWHAQNKSEYCFVSAVEMICFSVFSLMLLHMFLGHNCHV